MEIIYKSELLFCEWDEARSYFKLNWFSQITYHDADFHRIIIQELTIVQNSVIKYQPQYVMTNGENRNFPFPVSTHQKLAEFVVFAFNEGNVKKVATVFPPELIPRLSAEQVIEDGFNSGEIQNTKNGFFESVQEAENWLFAV